MVSNPSAVWPPTAAPGRRATGAARGHRRKLRWKSSTTTVCAALFGIASFVGLHALLGQTPAATEPPLSALAQLDRLAWRMGLGLDQVEISGHRFASDADILDAVDLANVHSFVSFDTAAIRARIERLPWVATAAIERRLPNQVAIHIKERAPFAVWRRGPRDVLIDRTGRQLSIIARGAAADLPRIEGEQAPDDAAQIGRAHV